jgi:hypothetical protein
MEGTHFLGSYVKYSTGEILYKTIGDSHTHLTTEIIHVFFKIFDTLNGTFELVFISGSRWQACTYEIRRGFRIMNNKNSKLENNNNKKTLKNYDN